MNMQDLQPMQFTEIGQGDLFNKVQEKFLKAVSDAANFGQTITLSLKINVFPPDPQQPSYANVNFEVSNTVPKSRSIKYIARLSGGMPVATSNNINDLMQIDMFENQPIVHDSEPAHKPEIK